MMRVETKLLGERSALVVRRILLVVVAVLLALLVFAKREGGGPPALMGAANANLISAAPGYIALSAPQAAGNFYIIDSNKQVICVYQTDGEKIRLVSAREFSQDMEIVDSSQPMPTPSGKPVGIEGNGTGVTRAEAQFYAESLKKWLDDLEKNKKP